MMPSPIPATATRIEALDVAPLNLPLHAPFGISGGAHAEAKNVLVTVRLADGTVGYGEAAPLPPYNGETQSDVLEAFAAATPWLLGRDAAGWHDLAGEFRAGAGRRSGSAQAALDMALLDALTRRSGLSVTQFFGGAGGELETDMTITTGTPGEARAAALAIRERGIRWIKVKIGGHGGPAHDLARLEAIHSAAPDAPLVLDGNAGLSRTEARELVHGLRRRGITPSLLEQWLPKDDLEGMSALRRESGWTVAADESAANAADVHRIADAGAADVVNVKLMKGGVVVAREVVWAARHRGLKLMIGGNVESILAMTVAACFAAGLGGFSYADLDTPLFLARNPFAGGYALEGGRISVAGIRLGHGVSPLPVQT